MVEVERAIDRCLPVFNSATQMRAYKREIQKLEDLGSKYHAKAMRDDSPPENAHIYARINERYCAMQGWSSVNVRLDPYAGQVSQQPSQHERIRDAIMQLTDRQPPAQREAISLIGKIGGERALELLKAGSGRLE